MFLQRFLMGNVGIALLICVMLGLRRLLRDALTPKFQYLSWYLLLPSMAMPFLPDMLWKRLGAGHFRGEENFAIRGAGETAAPTAASGSGWLQDAVQLAAGPSSGWLDIAVLSLWLLGVTAMAWACLRGFRKLRRIRRYGEQPPENIQALFRDCKGQIVPGRSAALLLSRQVSAPVSFGIHPPVVVLPKDAASCLSQTELRHILLHELTHIRHRDIVTNYVFCAVQAVFWCNPFVWLALCQARRDRECYCDWAVLNGFASGEARIRYGRTLLRFAAMKRTGRSQLVSPFSPGRSQLKYRLERIAAFRRDTGRSRIACGFCTALLLLVSMAQVPAMASCMTDRDAYYTPNEALTIIEADFDDLFHGTEGCAVVYDRNGDRYTAYNREKITRRLPPCSTYKICSALNALDLGLIQPQSSTLPWDGTQYGNPSWNRDQDLPYAMRASTNWYFQQLDRMAGIRQLAGFYEKIGYGNQTLGRDASAYWNGSALRISPLEQVELLSRLHRNAYGFRAENLQAVFDSIRLSSVDGAVLYGKTGTGSLDGQNIAGWFIGFVERGDNVYFFAVYLCSDAGSDGAAAADTAIQILKEMDIL